MKRIIYFLILTSSLMVKAQNVSFDNILSIEVRNRGKIVKNEKIVGYYLFYAVEKIDYDNTLYLFKVLDENLKEIVSEKMINYRNINLQEVAFDGETMLLKFYSSSFKDGGTKYFTYDKLNNLKPLILPKQNKKDGHVYNDSPIAGPETINKSLFAAENKGFFNYAISDAKEKGFEIIHFSSKGDIKWTFISETKSGEKDIANILTIGKNYLYSVVSNYAKASKFSSQFGNEIKQYISYIDIETGKENKRTKIEDPTFQFQILFGKEEDNTLTVFGVFFPKAATKMDQDSPFGIFTASFDSNGTLINKKMMTFDGDIRSLFPVASYNAPHELGNLYFHNIFQTSDKKIYAVAENYKFEKSGLNTALRIIGANTSIYDFVTNDLLVFEFNPDFTLAQFKVFEKSKSYISMPAGYGLYEPAKVAHTIKRNQLFDYLFTQINPEDASFIIGYKDVDKIDDKEKEYNFETIGHKNDTYSSDKMNLKLENDILVPLQAKFGYVLISGYLKEEKRLEMRLEKINY